MPAGIPHRMVAMGDAKATYLRVSCPDSSIVPTKSARRTVFGPGKKFPVHTTLSTKIQRRMLWTCVLKKRVVAKYVCT